MVRRIGMGCAIVVVTIAAAFVRGGEAAGAGSRGPATRPSYDWVKVDEHRQLYGWSCIPMSVELVLKLLGREPGEYFDLQRAWQNRKDGTFTDFDGRTIAGVTFRRQFFLPRDARFPMDSLFATIDSELDAGRYVIVSLWWRSAYHMFVIVDRTPGGDYRAVSKAGDVTMEVSNVKARVRAIMGTDIMTYSVGEGGKAGEGKRGK